MGLHLPRAATLAFVLILCGNAGPAQRDPSETITLYRSYAFCAGLCPDYQFTVAPGGQVVATDTMFNRSWRFQVSPEEVTELREMLAPGAPSASLDCKRHSPASGFSLPMEFEMGISWSAIPPSPRFACAGPLTSRLLASLEHALTEWRASLPSDSP